MLSQLLNDGLCMFHGQEDACPPRDALRGSPLPYQALQFGAVLFC